MVMSEPLSQAEALGKDILFVPVTNWRGRGVSTDASRPAWLAELRGGWVRRLTSHPLSPRPAVTGCSTQLN